MSFSDFIRRLFSWIPVKVDPPDPVSADARTSIATSILQPVANKYGLTYREPRQWYAQDGPIRLTLRLSTEGKRNSHGELYWGVGLDCIPDIDRGWTRTFKSAVPHVEECWSTVNPNELPRKTVSFVSGEEGMRNSLVDVLSDCETAIEKFYRRMATGEGVLAYVQERLPKEPHYSRYHFYLPFLLKECGRLEEARAELELYIGKHPNMDPKWQERLRSIVA